MENLSTGNQPTLDQLATEQPHPHGFSLDTASTLEILQWMNELDQTVIDAVRQTLPRIAEAVDAIVERLRRGGRLLYFGAGTSGRLAALDAVEWEPTFNTPRELVQAFIAGGHEALRHSVEGAEDDDQAGERTVGDAEVQEADVVVGVTASGRTPYVVGALKEARRRGAYTIGLACNRPSGLAFTDCPIEVETGPEILSGSTRLRAGTAQKMVLNMLSTASMAKLGKVFGHLMVDLKPTNH